MRYRRTQIDVEAMRVQDTDLYLVEMPDGGQIHMDADEFERHFELTLDSNRKQTQLICSECDTHFVGFKKTRYFALPHVEYGHFGKSKITSSPPKNLTIVEGDEDMNTKEISVAQELISRQERIQSLIETICATESQEVMIPCPDPTVIFIAPTISIDKVRFVAFLKRELQAANGELYALGVDMPGREKA